MNDVTAVFNFVCTNSRCYKLTRSNVGILFRLHLFCCLPFSHRRAFLISVFSVRSHLLVSSLTCVFTLLCFRPVFLCSLASVPSLISLPSRSCHFSTFLSSPASSLSCALLCAHLFLARDSLVSILGRTQASFITHLPSTHSNSYNFFSL